MVLHITLEKWCNNPKSKANSNNDYFKLLHKEKTLVVKIYIYECELYGYSYSNNDSSNKY